MRKMMHLVLVLGIAFTMISCEEFFQLMDMNVFSEMENPVIGVDSTAEEIAGEVTSDTYIETLAENTDLKTTILATLETTMNDTAATPEAQVSAAVAYTTIQLETTGGAEAVANLFEIVPSLTSGDLDTSNAAAVMQTVLSDMFSTESAEPPSLEVFTATLTAMSDSAAAFNLIGDTFTDTDGDGVVDAPDSVVIGDLAQSAVVCAIVDVVASTPENIQAIYDIAFGTEEQASAAVATLTTTVDFASTVETIQTDATYAGVFNILAASGLDALIAGLTGSNS